MPFASPKQNLDQCLFSKGAHVADFGVGSGEYAFVLAKRVGEAGRVYAVDVQKSLLERIKNEGHKQGFSNIEIVQGDLEHEGSSQLRGNSMDAVIASNILFQTEHKENLLKEAYRVLRSGGRLLVIDWQDSFEGLGPERNAVVSEGAVKNMCNEIGFEMVNKINSGDYHYGLVFRKK
jgi:ubiquinone/menaquinone biosynthesis C-methylase UbiE